MKIVFAVVENDGSLKCCDSLPVVSVLEYVSHDATVIDGLCLSELRTELHHEIGQ